MPTCASGDRPAELDTVPVPLCSGTGAVLLCPGTFQKARVHAPGGRPAGFGPTADLEVAL